MPLNKAQITASVSPVLTEHARRLRPGEYLSSQIFPPLYKPGQVGGQLQVWDETNLIVPDDMARAIGAKASVGSGAKPSYRSYTTERVARKQLQPQRELDEAAAHGQNPDLFRAQKVDKIVDQIMLYKERNLASKLNTSGNYASDYSTNLGTTWAAPGGTPIDDIKTGIAKMASGGVYPNVAIMDYSVWIVLSLHSSLLEFSKYVTGGALSEQVFESIFKLRPMVGRLIYNDGSAKAPVWEDSCILAYINPAMQPIGQSDMTLGRTVVSKDFLVTEYEANEYDQDGAEWIEGEVGFTHEFIGVDNATDGKTVAGYLIDNAV